MAKLEAAHKKDIVDAIRDASGYATRIEDQFRVGVLDLILSMPSTGIVLAEAKRFDGRFFEPSPRQYIEMCRIDQGGGVALLIGIKDGLYYLHGTNRHDHPRGRVYKEQCTFGDYVPEVFERWFQEGKPYER